jgi:hypothetical protein
VSGNKRLQELIRNAGGIEALERLVQEKSARESLSIEEMIERHLESSDHADSDSGNAHTPTEEPNDTSPPKDGPAEDCGDEFQDDTEDDGPCTCDDPQVE